MKRAINVVLAGMEFVALSILMVYALMRIFLPVGIATTASGESLRFRFSPGQDELIGRCWRVQVAFMTKDSPVAFKNRANVERRVLDRSAPYETIDIPAPVGTIGFRLDFHGFPDANAMDKAPCIEDISLGKCRLDRSELMQGFEETRHVPFFRCQPEFIWNISPLLFRLGLVFGAVAFLGFVVVICACLCRRRWHGL